MLFDLNHSLYIVISLLVTAGLLFLFSRFRSPSAKANILKATGIVTIVIHVSSVWVEFLIRGRALKHTRISCSPSSSATLQCTACLYAGS